MAGNEFRCWIIRIGLAGEMLRLLRLRRRREGGRGKRFILADSKTGMYFGWKGYWLEQTADIGPKNFVNFSPSIEKQNVVEIHNQRKISNIRLTHADIPQMSRS